jgi:type I restriction enzyme S subunit
MIMLASSSDGVWKPSEFSMVPSDWNVFEIFDFEPFITSGSRGWAKYYSDAGAPFIRITNLSHDDIYPNLSDLRVVAVPHADAEAKRTQLRVGDVLISITADIGAIGYVERNIPLPSYINQHIACVRLPEQAVDSKYVAYFLASAAAQHRFETLLDVGAKTGLNLTTIGRLKVLCPPLQEQHVIAQALSDADAWIDSMEALLAKKRAIKQGAMQELLTGKRRLCPSSDDLRPIRRFEKGGSGSSGVRV